MDLTAAADTPKDLFEALAQQFFDHLVEQNDVGPALREIVMVDAPDLAGVLLAGMRALQGLFTDQKMVFGQVAVTELTNPASGSFSLRAQATGELYDAQRHVIHLPPGDWILRSLELTKTARGFAATVHLDRRTP